MNLNKLYRKLIVPVFALASMGMVSTASAATLSLVDSVNGLSSVELGIGESVTFNLVIEGLTQDLFAAGYAGTYDPAVASLDSAVGAGGFTSFSGAVIDSGAGTVTDGLSTFGATDPVSQLLASFTFTALSNGSFNFVVADDAFQGGFLYGDFSQVLNDLGGTDLIATANISVVPLPAAVWLFGSALIGLVGMSRRQKQRV